MRTYGLPFIFGAVLAISLSAPLPAGAENVDWPTLLKRAIPMGEKFTQVSNLATYKAKGEIRAAFPAYRNDAQMGIVYYSTPMGYGGIIHTLIALDMKGTITKVEIIGHSETPAYVGNITDGSYQRQFEGITISDKMVFLIGIRPAKRGEVMSITGSTATAKPIAIAVSEARKLFVEMYAQSSNVAQK